MMTTASVVISLDFELRWGVADSIGDSPDAYRRNLEGETDAVHGMLDYFVREGIGATWATVGALACSGWDEYQARSPQQPENRTGRTPFKPAWKALDPDGRLHFAPQAVDAIARTPGQELASHTFSHIYFREPGIGPEEVFADSIAVADVFKERTGRAPTSFVFPRNQVAHTKALKRAGIVRWRSNPRAFYWNATRRDEQSRVVRLLRMLDSIASPTSNVAPAREHRASHFVRFSLPDRLWKMHVRRISRDAARLGPGNSLHLWWHPHNLGADVHDGLRRLDELVTRVREAVPEGTRFTNMEQSVSPA